MNKILHDKKNHIYIAKIGTVTSLSSESKKYVIITPGNHYFLDISLKTDVFYGDQVVCTTLNKNGRKKSLRVNTQYPVNNPAIVKSELEKYEPDSALLPALNLICEDEKNQYKEEIAKFATKRNNKQNLERTKSVRSLIKTMIREKDIVNF